MLRRVEVRTCWPPPFFSIFFSLPVYRKATMEKLNFDYPASRPVRQRTHVGVVGSGDLEVLLEPSSDEMAHVTVRTSVDGFGQIWKQVMDRFFSRYQGAATIEINDFGATPGMVILRLEQAVEGSL
jgi:malonate decarboxylase delta subunit